MSRRRRHRGGTDAVTVAVARGAMTLTTSSPAETRTMGRRLGTQLQGGEVIGLTGDLGAGKTCLIQGLAEGLGVDAGAVTSPTFVFLHHHRGRVPLYHVDLYRAETAEHIETLGLFEMMWEDPAAVVVIEWADRATTALPVERLMIRLAHLTRNAGDRRPGLPGSDDDQHRRQLHFEARGPRYLHLIEGLRDTMRPGPRPR